MDFRAIPISDNILFIDDPFWGNYDPNIVKDIVRFIDTDFSKNLNIKPFSTTKCYIFPNINGKAPCIQNMGTHHSIQLVAQGTKWELWIYQFAHEYCHHLINGKMIKEETGLWWFEETLCELASMYQLNQMALYWENQEDPIRHNYAQKLKEMLDSLHRGERCRNIIRGLPEIGFPNWFVIWDEAIHRLGTEDGRWMYNRIADALYPIFIESPILWHIILHLGDSRQWPSLRAFFDDLPSKLPTQALTPLNQMRNLFQL